MGVTELAQRRPRRLPGKPGLFSCSAPTSQRGQILPITTFFLAAILLAIWIVNDSGELMIEKMRLQNTADATAYSTAVLMARNWNYAAYMNRAMVANQATIGQGVGFAAWNKGCIRYVFACTPMAVIDLAYINYYLGENDQTLTELSSAQDQFNQGAAAAEAQLSSDVTVANDPDVQQVTYFNWQAPSTQAGVPTTQWQVPQLLELMAANGRRFTEFKNVVIGSQDHFTANRSFNWPATNLLVYKNQPKEYGGSELIQGVQDGHYTWEWTALDTLSDYSQYWLFGWHSNGESPHAYAAARAPVAGSPASFNYNAYSGNTTMWGMGAWKNPKSAAKAASADATNNIHTMSGAGLRPFLDVSNDYQSDEGDTVLILMKKPESSLSIQKNWATATNSSYQVPTQIDDQADGGLMYGHIATLAKAQVYFYRPYESGAHQLDWNRRNLPSWITGDSEYSDAFKNQNYRYEHGSLYSPFWDAHLVDTTDDERRYALQFDQIP